MTLRLGAAMILLLMRYASTQTYCGMWWGNGGGIGTVAPKNWRFGEVLYELGSSTWQAALELCVCQLLSDLETSIHECLS